MSKKRQKCRQLSKILWLSQSSVLENGYYSDIRNFFLFHFSCAFVMLGFDITVFFSGMFPLFFSHFSWVEILQYVAVLLVSLTIHEYAHAKTAWYFGDLTAWKSGRVSLNPLAHLDPVGTMCWVLFGFGFGRAVPVSFDLSDRGQKHDMLTALAGPSSNLFLAFAALIPVQYGLVPEWGMFLFQTLVGVNLTLAVFNLLPFFPLDGSHVVAYLCRQWPSFVRQFYHYSAPVLFAIIGLDFFLQTNILWAIVTPIRDFCLFLFLILLP